MLCSYLLQSDLVLTGNDEHNICGGIDQLWESVICVGYEHMKVANTALPYYDISQI